MKPELDLGGGGGGPLSCTVPAMTPIRKVAVLGAGVMGSGIAAHAANAGLPVLMLDMAGLAAPALAAMKKHRPAPLFSAAATELIQTGSFEEDLPRIRDCDWVVEVV